MKKKKKQHQEAKCSIVLKKSLEKAVKLSSKDEPLEVDNLTDDDYEN